METNTGERKESWLLQLPVVWISNASSASLSDSGVQRRGKDLAMR